MSEALSTSEIEDVLSSIRRLVSDDLRPVVKPAVSSDEGSKLLLTPALRVVQDAGDHSEARQIDDVVTSLGAAVDQQDGDWESETGDTSPEVPMADHPAEIWEDAPVIEDYATGFGATTFEFVSSRAAEAVEAVDEAELVAEDAAVQASNSATVLEPADAVASTESVQELPGWAQSAGADEADEPRPEPSSRGSIEPDQGWADAAEAAVLQELHAAAPFAAALSGDDSALDEPEVPVDEAMLREIVRDVLREELQGRLGERITRNIRKLVRAEIARVMAADDLL